VYFSVYLYFGAMVCFFVLVGCGLLIGRDRSLSSRVVCVKSACLLIVRLLFIRFIGIEMVL